MTHFDTSTLAAYNALADPHLESYFSNDRIRSHLIQAGLIGNHGEIIADGEYRTRLAQREHRRHVRHMLAESIVDRAIDMERNRRAEIKRQQDLLVKAAMVNNVKESRRRAGPLTGLMTYSADLALFSLDPYPPASGHDHGRGIESFDEPTRCARAQSAHHPSSKPVQRRRLRRRVSKQRGKSSAMNHVSSTPCRITMVYFGPHTKVDYDHLVFDDVDEILVMQQHCGGENLPVYKDKLKAGDEFTFDSRRHADFPFGLSLYVKGLIDSRISTCCEYKHRHGVRLGGDRGHFAIKSVRGSTPCIKCRFEKEARLKKLAQSPKDKPEKTLQAIIIPMPISEEPKRRPSPIQISVQTTSTSSSQYRRKSPPPSSKRRASADDNYSEDFDGSDRDKAPAKTGYATDASSTRSIKVTPKRSTPPVQAPIKPASRKSSARSSARSPVPKQVEPSKKTWQLIFYPSDLPRGNVQFDDTDRSSRETNAKINVSLVGNGQETETYAIDLQPLIEDPRSTERRSVSIKLKEIGHPDGIIVKIDTDERDGVKWHLDRIELIDPESQSRLLFSCGEWIGSSKVQILHFAPKDKKPPRPPASDSSSSQRSSTDDDTARSATKKVSKAKPSIDADFGDADDLVQYRLIIHPSSKPEGEFTPTKNSRIYIRLNNQKKERNLFADERKHKCPKFQPGKDQAFQVDFTQTSNEKPRKLAIGYVNQDAVATRWKLDKIVLINVQSGEETTFRCDKDLVTDDGNVRAEQTFEAETKKEEQSDEERTPRNETIQTAPAPSPPKKEAAPQSPPPKKDAAPQSPQPKKEAVPPKKAETPKRSPSVESFPAMTDEEATYKKVFRRLDSKNELELGSEPPSPRSKTAASSVRQASPHVDPLVGLEDLTNQTARSRDDPPKSLPATSTEIPFKKWYSENEEDDFH